MTLLKIYRTVVRSSLNYGLSMYGISETFYPRTLDSVHYTMIRIALNLLRTSPVVNILCELNEWPLTPCREYFIVKLSVCLNRRSSIFGSREKESTVHMYMKKSIFHIVMLDNVINYKMFLLSLVILINIRTDISITKILFKLSLKFINNYCHINLLKRFTQTYLN